MYINAYISEKIEAAFNPEEESSKAELEKVKELALKFDAELGIVHATEDNK